MSHQDSAVRFVTAKRGPERATETRQYDLLRPNVGQKEPPRLGSTICKSHQDSAVRFVTAKSWPEKATKTRKCDLIRPNVGQKEPSRLGSMICYGQELARKGHQDSAVRFVTAKRGSTTCYGQTWARKSHQDSAVRFVTAKRGPERATKTRQYDLLRPRVGQKEPPRLDSTICYGQTCARMSHQDSAVRFVTAKRGPERATKTRQYDLIRPTERATETRQYDLLLPNVGQKEPPRLGSTIWYGQELARKSHQDSAVRFVTAKSWPERATKTRQYDLLRPRVVQKEPPRLGSTICYGQELARKSHRDSAVRFVTAKRGPERATKPRQYDLLRPRVGQKEPPRLGSTICYGQQKEPPRLGSTICYCQTWARKSQQDSAVRFVTAKRVPEKATKTRQYDLLRPRVGQKEPPRLGSTICCGQTWARRSHQDSAVRFVTAKRGPEKSHQDSAVRFVTARKSHQDSAVRFVTAKRGPERATKAPQYDLLRPRVVQKESPRLGSTICYGQALARKSHRDSAVRFVTAKRGPERATETRQYDLLRPNVGQKEPPRLGSTICCGQTWARKSHQDSAVRFVTAKSCPERATKTRQYDLLRPRVGPEMPPRLGSTICYGQTWARKSHQDSAVRCVAAKSWTDKATKTREYDLLRPNVGQKSHQDSAVRFVMAKRGPERATETRQYDCHGQELARKSHGDSQYDLLRPRVGQKEPPRLGSTICFGQTWARKSHQDSAVRFVTAKSWPERATVRFVTANVGQKEPPRLGSTICCGQTWARKSHQDSAVRFVTAKSWQKKPPRLGSAICYGQGLARRATKTRQYDFVAAKRVPEKATKTRQYGLLRPRVGQKEPPRLGSTICCGQELDKKNHQDSAVRFYRPNVGQKEPPRLGSTICYGQEVARKSHQDSTVRFVTAKSWPERATKTRQYDLLWPKVVCYGQTWARKSHQDSTVRFVTAKSCPERATKTRQYDLLRPRVGQKEPPRLGSTMCYGQDLATRATKTRQSDLLRPNVGHRDSAVRFVTAKTWPERATKTRQYDLLRPRLGQKEPPRLGSTICYGQTWARKSHKTRQYDCYGQTWARKSHQDSAVRFVTAKTWPEKATKTGKKPPRLGSTICYSKCGPERATKTRQYELLRPRVGQKEPPRLGSTICYGQELSRKSHQDSAVRFVTAKRGPERATKTWQYDLLRPRVGPKEPPRLGSTICYGKDLARRATNTRQYALLLPRVGQERATKTRQYDLLRPRVGQKKPPRLGSTICCGQTWARKRHEDSAVRFVTAKSWPERATKTQQYDLLRPRVGQKEPPRLGSTICYGQTWARKSHQDSAVRFVTAKSCPERVTKTRQYDLLRPSVGQKKPPRLGSTICYGQTWARKSHRDSAVRFVTAKRGPERATETRQYDLLRPNVGQKEPPRLGSTICYGQTWARKSHRDSQYDLLRPNVGQKEPPRLGSTICYGQTLARKSHQDSAVRFVTAKRGPERATKTRQYDLLRPNVGQKEPPRLGSTICYGQDLARKSHQDSAVRFVTASVGQKEPPRLGSTICYGQELARKSHQDSAVRFVTAKRGPERATETRQYDLLRPNVGQKEPPGLGSTICYSQEWPERATKTRQYDLLRPRVGQKEPPRLGSTICYGQELARKATKTLQYGFLRPRVGQKEPPRLGSTICCGQELAKKNHQDSAVRFYGQTWAR